MSVLTASNLSLSFGAFDLFQGITLSVPENATIGLIGPNGVGKTSLLLILAGINQQTSGQIHFARGRKLGYLRQEAVDAFADRDHTVHSEMLTVFEPLTKMQSTLHQMEADMAGGSYSDELLESYGELQLRFEQSGGYEYELLIQQTLQGLGLGEEYWHEPLNHLSGGQKTRALLARLLLQKPDLLILDEPTNHLDIEAVEWLENTLRKWEGAVLIVSHDRYFLDNTVSVIWEMGPGGIEVYSGNYSAYLLQREERWEYYEKVFEEEKARLLKEVDFVQKNWVRESTHARALGLLRRLTRDLAIVDAYGIMGLRNGKKWSEFDADTIQSANHHLDVVEAIRKVNAIQMPSNRPPRIKPRLSTQQRSGNVVLSIDKVTIGYPGNALFKAHDVELRRGECAALIGPNGSGKTTFLKVLMGELEELAGRVQHGASVKIGYLAQAHDALNTERSVLDELTYHKPMRPAEARSYLAQYLFRGEDVFKPVGALSGGEKARLALAILALEGANFLLLDEPTNHLDIPARESLQEVLDVFPGTILIVSHDRYLIDRLATQIWNLHDQKLVVFKGKYREFVLRESAKSAPGKTAQVMLPPRPLLRGNSKDTRQLAQSISQLEERIRQQESTIQRISHELHEAGKQQSFDRTYEISNRLAQAQAALDQLMAEWEKLVVRTGV
jgi:ATP-binding cassette subfamily F protein 3